MCLLGRAALPDPDTLGDRLRRMGDSTTGQTELVRLGQVRDILNARLLRPDGHETYTLDADATLVETEHFNKELKTGLGMDPMPCGDAGAHAGFFRIGVLAYNLFIGFKRLACPASQAPQPSCVEFLSLDLGWDVSWHNSRCGVMLIRNPVGVNESAPGTVVLSREC